MSTIACFLSPAQQQLHTLYDPSSSALVADQSDYSSSYHSKTLAGGVFYDTSMCPRRAPWLLAQNMKSTGAANHTSLSEDQGNQQGVNSSAINAGPAPSNNNNNAQSLMNVAQPRSLAAAPGGSVVPFPSSYTRGGPYELVQGWIYPNTAPLGLQEESKQQFSNHGARTEDDACSTCGGAEAGEDTPSPPGPVTDQQKHQLPVAAALLEDLELIPLFLNEQQKKRSYQDAGGSLPGPLNKKVRGESTTSPFKRAKQDEADFPHPAPSSTMTPTEAADNNILAPGDLPAAADLAGFYSDDDDDDAESFSSSSSGSSSGIMSVKNHESDDRKLAAVSTSPAKSHQQREREVPSVAPANMMDHASPLSASSPRSLPKQQETKWNKQFRELCEFKKANGHVNVPHNYKENPILARWVKRQRHQYRLMKEGRLQTAPIPDSRIQALEDIGFVWDVYGDVWKERVAELRQYKERFASCDVPCRYKENPVLAIWVKCQRRQYKLFMEGRSSSITADRIEELEEMGFCWGLRNYKNRGPNPNKKQRGGSNKRSNESSP